MSVAIPPHHVSFLFRLASDPDRMAKIEIGNCLAQRLQGTAQKIFVSNGTTANICAMELLRQNNQSAIVTHSAPLPLLMMAFQHFTGIAPTASLSLVAGTVEPTTGMIIHGRLPKAQSETFVYAPKAINETGLYTDRHAAQIKAAWKDHNKVFLLSVYARFLDAAATEPVKRTGFLRNFVKDGNSCTLLIPSKIPASYAREHTDKINAILKVYEDAGVKIVKSPAYRGHKSWEEFSSRIGKLLNKQKGQSRA